MGAKVRVAIAVAGGTILGAVQGDKEDQDDQRGHAGERDHDVLVVRHRSGVVLGGLEFLKQHNHQTVDGLVEEALCVKEKRSRVNKIRGQSTRLHWEGPSKAQSHTIAANTNALVALLLMPTRSLLRPRLEICRQVPAMPQKAATT